ARPWANRPYPLITTPTAKGAKASVGSIHVATGMALAHNLFIRYLNSIYLQATGITRSEDVDAFLLYCRAWCTIIHEHHQGEETTFFSMIAEYTAEKDIMKTSVEQHNAFDSGIQVFEKYVTETPPKDYSGSTLRTLIDNFAPALVKHLHAEISTLLSIGEEFGGEKLRKSYDEWEKQVMKESRAKSDPYVMLPAGFGAVDRAFENGAHRNWPEFPWFVPYLNKFVFARTHAKAWQFSP
ncbi:hypothetical protein OIDMADRAFT_75892, partial [Oidiodendron maius Zn]